jgi:hypothetical protein
MRQSDGNGSDRQDRQAFGAADESHFIGRRGFDGNLGSHDLG